MMRSQLALVLALAAACTPARTTETTQVPSSLPDSVPAARASGDAGARRGALSVPNADPSPSTYRAAPARATVIRNATILTAAGPALRNASILIRDGKVVEVGTAVNAPADAIVVDGAGKYVTPGLID